MLFKKVLGQEKAKKILNGVLLKDRPAGSYLFCGPEGTGKTALAQDFARALICPYDLEECNCPDCHLVETGKHPDLLAIFPEGEMIKIEEIRTLIEMSYLAPARARIRVNLIDQADRLTEEAANALLKLLEEPPSTSINLLVSSRPQQLPPTIISRCFDVPFGFLSSQVIEQYLIGKGVENAKLIAGLAGGRISRAIFLAEEGNWKKRNKNLLLALEVAADKAPISSFNGLFKEKDMRNVRDFLWVFYSLWRDLVLVSSGGETIVNEDYKKEIHQLASSRQLGNWLEGSALIEKAMELSYTTVNMGMLLPALIIELQKGPVIERRKLFVNQDGH